MTEITVIDRAVQTMLDTGAACNAIPEELVTGMLRRAAKLGIREGSDEFPVVALEKWKVAEHVEGVAAGKRVDLLGSVVIRAEMGYRHDRTPVREFIRCKIFPAGMASFMGIILGGRTLDAVSQGGMGLQVRDKSYYLALYDIELPRKEGPRRKRIGEAMSAQVPPYLLQEHCAMTVSVGASAVDSDAEDGDDYVQFVNVQSDGARTDQVVDSNTLVYHGLDPVVLEPQDGAWVPVSREASDTRVS